ncbi:MAG: phosphoglycerate mutase family protein [Bacteroidota bacterium]
MLKKPLLVLVLLVALLSCKKDYKEETPETVTTTYYLIRHAEKDRSDKANRNPNLTETGQQRAQNWAKYFDTIPLDAVYSTNYLRTIQTATPTAKKKGLEIQSYDPGNMYDQAFKLATKEKKVLVVGHSNTTPVFVNKILGEEKYPWMHDKDNASLYKVTIRDSVVNVVIETVEN